MSHRGLFGVTRSVHAASALVVAVVMMSAPAHARLVIDEVDTTKFQDRNEVVVFLDIFDDATGQVLKGQGAAGIKVFIDDVEVPGTVEVKTFREANQALGVAILMAAHAGYAWVVEEAGSSVLTKEKAGFKNFLGRLTDQDRVAAWSYTENGLSPLAPWSNVPSQVADGVERLLKPAEDEGRDRAPRPPLLYGAIAKVLDAMVEDEANQPRRRVLVVMSDGTDVNTIQKPAVVESKVREIAENARAHGIKVYAIGFTLDVPEPLVTLGALAEKTHGNYRGLDKFDRISDDVADLADELQNEYVLTFKPTAYTGSDKPASVRVELTANGGTLMKRVVDGVRFPVRAVKPPAPVAATAPAAPPAAPATASKGGCGGCAAGDSGVPFGLVGVFLGWLAIVRRSLPSRSARGA